MSGKFESTSWEPRLLDLSDRLREVTRATLAEAQGGSSTDDIARPVSVGAGDFTFGLDVPSERVCDEWFAEVARDAPLSLLTEDSGWRHRGPQGELAGFEHGGPRIAVDPIDGTRNLMANLRSAWSILSMAEPGAGIPHLGDVSLGIVSELPALQSNRWRRLIGRRGAGCQLAEDELGSTKASEPAVLRVDTDTRCDHGYFPFFRYERSQAKSIAAIETEFHQRLATRECADTRSIYDDQYISNGGQLVLLALGTYRFVADLRAWLSDVLEVPTTTSKPYDSAGAVLCAREAGAILEDAQGKELDYPLDTTTPVSFVGFVNEGTRRRLRPHLDAALARAKG